MFFVSNKDLVMFSLKHPTCDHRSSEELLAYDPVSLFERIELFVCISNRSDCLGLRCINRSRSTLQIWRSWSNSGCCRRENDYKCLIFLHDTSKTFQTDKSYELWLYITLRLSKAQQVALGSAWGPKKSHSTESIFHVPVVLRNGRMGSLRV